MTPFIATALGLLIIAAAYLLGSISFAVVVSRNMGLQDPRTFGSKNPGATNVLRSGNKTAALLTLSGDALKGLVAVWLAQWLAGQLDLGTWVVAAAAVAAFLGHVYPVFLGFKGGKGVATALGVLLGLQPVLALATVATWLIVAYASKYSSLAAIMAAIFAPLYYLFGGNVIWRLEPVMVFAIIVISVMLCFRHSANITRLMKGTEPRIGAGKNTAGKPSKKH